VAASANLGQAVLAAAQSRLAASGQWVLNEKGIVERAGLGEANAAISELGLLDAIDRVDQLLGTSWF